MYNFPHRRNNLDTFTCYQRCRGGCTLCFEDVWMLKPPTLHTYSIIPTFWQTCVSSSRSRERKHRPLNILFWTPSEAQGDNLAHICILALLLLTTGMWTLALGPFGCSDRQQDMLAWIPSEFNQALAILLLLYVARGMSTLPCWCIHVLPVCTLPLETLRKWNAKSWHVCCNPFGS